MGLEETLDSQLLQAATSYNNCFSSIIKPMKVFSSLLQLEGCSKILLKSQSNVFTINLYPFILLTLPFSLNNIFSPPWCLLIYSQRAVMSPFRLCFTKLQ